jgi:ATP-dependent Clp protease ATP-binding subunit ClpA
LGKPVIGFEDRAINESAIGEAVKKHFAPEFRNRLDAVVTFNGLDEVIVRQIVKKNIRLFQRQLQEKNVTLEITDRCYEWLARKGFSKLFGAREVGRLIQDKIKNWFVDEVLFGRLVNGGNVIADIVDDDVIIKPQG